MTIYPHQKSFKVILIYSFILVTAIPIYIKDTSLILEIIIYGKRVTHGCPLKSAYFKHPFFILQAGHFSNFFLAKHSTISPPQSQFLIACSLHWNLANFCENIIDNMMLTNRRTIYSHLCQCVY